jgi:hypothetical protein
VEDFAGLLSEYSPVEGGLYEASSMFAEPAAFFLIAQQSANRSD